MGKITNEQVREAIEMMNGSFEISNFLQREYVSNIITSHIAELEVQLANANALTAKRYIIFNEVNEECTMYQSRLNAIKQVVEDMMIEFDELGFENTIPTGLNSIYKVKERYFANIQSILKEEKK